MTQALGVPHSFAAVTQGRAAAVVATIAAVSTAAVSVLSGLGVAVRVDEPVMVAAHFSAVVLLAIDAWLLSARRSVAAAGVAIVAAVGTATACASVLAFPDRLQAILASTLPVAVAGAGSVALGWRGPVGRAWWLVAVPSLAAAGILALGFDPLREPRCLHGCVDAPALLADLLSTRFALAAASILTSAAVVGLAIVAIRRGRSAAPIVVLAGASACAAAIAISATWRVVRWDARPMELSPVDLPTAGMLAIGLAVLAAVLVEARKGAAAVRLARGLTHAGVAPLTSAHFAVPGEGRWVDATGRAVHDSEDALIIESGGVPIARIAAPGRDVSDAASQFGASGLLALRNAQLAAVARARVAELRASQRRIVEIADAEGRRIERDLHDGAQQRLVSSMLYLAVARRTDPELGELAEAERAIRTALEQLRAIAHGLAPEVLRTEGVWAAVEELAAGASVPVELHVPTERPGDDDAGAVLHFGVSTTVDLATRASAERVVITGGVRDGALYAVVDVAGPRLAPEETTDAADRIGALGGRLSVSETEVGTRITMEVPCAS
ncbi:hypothetical protein J7E25_00360 [Agromyces sp. ISL-38]|uniref:sensor histidine kinase n=1 Tax=Agromyces sp. ISL-38 TaxID=2819107 RepID=UPI001BE7DF7D|nr:histidine kinase [Agromyces sp. ISL-38]MBT2497543.1 hypothetical protein [Agromyces sp. ISL-38]